MPKVDYRKLAFDRYGATCAHCGFGIPAILEVAHLDGDRRNNDVANLVVLCPTCHKMHDVGLIPTQALVDVRDNPRPADWSRRMKDAGKKAALKRKRRAAARKAVETRRDRHATQS